ADALTSGLLPEFGRDSLTFRLVGQVVAGLIPMRLDDGTEGPERVALTVQLVETRSGERARRLRVNLLGLPRAALVEAAANGEARGLGERVRGVLGETQRRVDVLARRVLAAERRGQPLDVDAEARPLLERLRAELQRALRPTRHRTRHAQERHQSGERPTGSAVSDALRASDQALLEDVRHGTVVVLGPRGRAHVFSPEGRHV